ncbi:MAG: MarC family protein [Gammaproteobacteria bacterium]|nr:MarC family protein [Gammaproteobacteria bacterium]
MEVELRSFLLLFVLLNPFILSIYLLELVKELSLREFSTQIVKAAVLSFAIFLVFAWAGDRIFADVLQIRFLAFMIFGGVIFLIVGVRLILGIGPPVEVPSAGHHDMSGAIAMPFIVGPGTISAVVIISSNHDFGVTVTTITLAMVAAVTALLVLKWLHDFVRYRNERYVERYTEIAGRVTALFTGSFAIDMILKGFERWMIELPP